MNSYIKWKFPFQNHPLSYRGQKGITPIKKLHEKKCAKVSNRQGFTRLSSSVTSSYPAPKMREETDKKWPQQIGRLIKQEYEE